MIQVVFLLLNNPSDVMMLDYIHVVWLKLCHLSFLNKKFRILAAREAFHYVLNYYHIKEIKIKTGQKRKCRT